MLEHVATAPDHIRRDLRDAVHWIRRNCGFTIPFPCNTQGASLL